MFYVSDMDDVCVSSLTALSSDEPGEEDVLDAGCLLDVLRLHRWHISSFEEQVSQGCFLYLCVYFFNILKDAAFYEFIYIQTQTLCVGFPPRRTHMNFFTS